MKGSDCSEKYKLKSDRHKISWTKKLNSTMKGKRERNLLNAVKRKKYPAKFLLSSNEIFSSDSPSLVFV